MSDTKNVDCHRSSFAYRRNADGSMDSICLCCYLTVATAGIKADLHELEAAHRCRGREDIAVIENGGRAKRS
jgi:hypothetical protein